SGAGILILLMFLPEGLGGLVYSIRDGLLRRVAKRRNLVVPSLLADVRVERQQEAEVDLGAVLSTNGSQSTRAKAKVQMAKQLENLDEPAVENIGREFGKFDLRSITYPAAVFPLVVLFGLTVVDELDRVSLAVILPNIRDWFGLSLKGVGLLTAATVPLAL